MLSKTKKIDLHIHTNYSDGQLNIFDILELAKKEKIIDIAITDHDTIINLKDVNKIAKLYDINLIAGIEITVGQPYNMHILGYGILDFEKVEEYIDRIKKDNIEICKNVIKLLQKNGYEITLEEVLEDIEKRRIENYISYKVIQRKCIENGIDIAKVKNIKNEPLNKRAIAKILVKKGYARNNKEVYDKIMGKNCNCYIPINKMKAKDAIELIKSAGGVAVLAHPNTIEVKNYNELEYLIDELKSNGLEGIEIVNMAEYDEKYSKILENLTEDKELIKTAGTDFHRTTDINNILGVEVENKIIIKLKEKIEKANKEYIERNHNFLEDRE